jgi:small-conductance mechanosensitive channel
VRIVMSESKKNLFNFSGAFTAIIRLTLIAIAIIAYFDPSQIALTIEMLNNSVYIVPKLFVLGILFLIFILTFSIFEYLLNKSKLFFDERTRPAALKLAKVVWWIIYVITSILILFKNVDALITSIGLIGLGLTFALQKPVLNFVGWLTILTQDLYSEGDRIRVGNIMGDVKKIQFMNTVVYGLLDTTGLKNQKIVTIPNELVLTTDVENYTKDSNYVLDELNVSITYESNYHKAMSLLESIITKNLKNNLKLYINREKKKKIKIESFLAKSENKVIESVSEKSTSELQKEKENIQKEIQNLEEIGEEFKPKIRLEIAESAIIISAQFVTPYNQVKKKRTEINIALLDAIKKEKDIELAYPHLELVLKKRSHYQLESLKKFE